MAHLQKDEQFYAWEFRKYWATQRSITVTLDKDRCMIPRVVGKVESVSVTGAFAMVHGWHIPTDAVRRIAPTLVTEPGFEERGPSKIEEPLNGQLELTS